MYLRRNSFKFENEISKSKLIRFNISICERLINGFMQIRASIEADKEMKSKQKFVSLTIC